MPNFDFDTTPKRLAVRRAYQIYRCHPEPDPDTDKLSSTCYPQRYNMAAGTCSPSRCAWEKERREIGSINIGTGVFMLDVPPPFPICPGILVGQVHQCALYIPRSGVHSCNSIANPFFVLLLFWVLVALPRHVISISQVVPYTPTSSTHLAYVSPSVKFARRGYSNLGGLGSQPGLEFAWGGLLCSKLVVV